MLAFQFVFNTPKPVISAETVEKPKLQDFKVYNYLILLHAKFEKMPKLGFFDSLAMYGRNFKPNIFTDITMPAKQSYGPNTGKKSVLFMVSVKSLYSTAIESVGTQS